MNERGFFQRCAKDGLTALCEATFPKNDIGAPDWESTDMVTRTLEYLDELPPKQKLLLQALFAFTELAAIFLIWGFHRFSHIPSQHRTEAIRRWRRSALFPLRLLGESIKAVTTMMYMSHPSVLRYIGEYRSCEHPADEQQIETRPDALAEMASRA